MNPEPPKREADLSAAPGSTNCTVGKGLGDATVNAFKLRLELEKICRFCPHDATRGTVRRLLDLLPDVEEIAWERDEARKIAENLDGFRRDMLRVVDDCPNQDPLPWSNAGGQSE